MRYYWCMNTVSIATHEARTFDRSRASTDDHPSFLAEEYYNFFSFPSLAPAQYQAPHKLYPYYNPAKRRNASHSTAKSLLQEPNAALRYLKPCLL